MIENPVTNIEMKLLSILICCILLISCKKCGENILIGSFELSQTSRQFMPYTGMETLVFKNSQGAEFRLRAPQGFQREDTRHVTKVLCQESALDFQYEYFNIQREGITFTDSSGNQLFYAETKTIAEETNSDSIPVYDFLLIDSNYGKIEIITEERQYAVSQHLRDLYSSSRLVGDTVLYGKSFSGVYSGSSDNGKAIFYNRSLGVILLKNSDTDYLLLDRIE